MEVLKRKNTEIEGDVLFKSSRKFPGTNERVFPDGKDLLNVQLRIKGSTLRISRFPEVTRNVPPLGMAFLLSTCPTQHPAASFTKSFPITLSLCCPSVRVTPPSSHARTVPCAWIISHLMLYISFLHVCFLLLGETLRPTEF